MEDGTIREVEYGNVTIIQRYSDSNSGVSDDIRFDSSQRRF
jgi:hypothetical protein